MRREYDFTHAEQGRFFRKGIKLSIPVYLDKRTLPFIERVAKRRGIDLSAAVNDILKGNMHLAQRMQ